MLLLLFARLKLDNPAGCWLALGCNSLSKIQLCDLVKGFQEYCEGPSPVAMPQYYVKTVRDLAH